MVPSSILQWASRIEQLIQKVIGIQEDLVEMVTQPRIEIDSVNSRLKEFFGVINELEKKIRSLDEISILRLLTNPRIKTTIDDAKFSLDSAMQIANLERLNRIDILSGILASVGIAVGIYGFFPRLCPEYKILIFVGTAIILTIFSRPFIKCLLFLYDLVPLKIK
ncbi:MAG: hypothetical protein QW051_04920 [Candidatus Aenigmatarchaeota archaeon]